MTLAGATRCDGTSRGPARVYQCQRRSLADSLRMGIRFFDLRFALDPLDARLVFWHGPALLSARADLDAVLFALFAFLDAHPSETILLSLQHERGTRGADPNHDVVRALLLASLTSPAARAYFLQQTNRLGTLGSARGKIILLRRFDVDAEADATLPGLHFSPRKWPDNSKAFELVYGAEGESAFIEDYYYPADHDSVEGNIRAKFDAVADHLRRAVAGRKEALFVTFTSATHVDAVPPVFPDVMALGLGRAHGALGVNYRLLGLLDALRGERVGVVVMDFFEEPGDLVGLMLGL